MATEKPVAVLRELQGSVTEVGDTAYNSDCLVPDPLQLNDRVAMRQPALGEKQCLVFA